MARIANTAKDVYAHVVEHTGGTLTALDNWMEVDAHSDTFTFAVTSVGAANYKLALECSFNGNGNWFVIDTSKTINAAGQYVYFYQGKAVTKIRIRIEQITSGIPDVTPHITVAYEG